MPILGNMTEGLRLADLQVAFYPSTTFGGPPPLLFRIKGGKTGLAKIYDF